MLKADEEFFAKTGTPLFSSHMLDLSEETDDENIATCAKYFERMAKMGQWLEMEIGITGGEEDGVNNEHVEKMLYTLLQKLFSLSTNLYTRFLQTFLLLLLLVTSTVFTNQVMCN